MKRTMLLPLAFLLILVGSYAPVFARIGVAQTETGGCPTYQTAILVDFVNSTPINAFVGETVVTTIHVIYPDGSPVTLSPETVTFLWTGTVGQSTFDSAPVVYTGRPGYYNYTQPITNELVSATGQGKITISVKACSCHDGLGNSGPSGHQSSDTTLTPTDNSNLNVGPPTGGPGPVNWIIPAIIAILLIIALLLFLSRARKKKK